MKRALLLNADWAPLHFVSDIKALYLVMKGRAEVINGMDGKLSIWEESFTSPTIKIPIPATLKLHKRVNKRWKPPRFRKKVLFNRDNWQCQYCGTPLTHTSVSIDHVLPSSRGGGTTWKNCVTACKPCNKKKANKTPDEAQMYLMKTPDQPTAFHFWDAMRSTAWHSHWDCFIKRQ